VRSGKGPIILEMKTYRYRGHSMSDPAKYRSKEEVEDVRTHHDPIDTLKDLLMKDYNVSEADFKKIDDDVKEICKKSAEFAQESPEPDVGELYTDVLIEAHGQKSAAPQKAAAKPAPSSSNDISW